jgi:hypothetical protein
MSWDEGAMVQPFAVVVSGKQSRNVLNIFISIELY